MTALDDMLAKANEVLALDEKATPGPWRSSERECGAVYADWRVSHPRGGMSLQVALSCGQAAMYDERGTTAEIQRANAAAIASYRTTCPDLARALKAVAEALDEAAAGYSLRRYTVDDIRAAIERRITRKDVP